MGDVYYYYGISLLELAREEANLLNVDKKEEGEGEDEEEEEEEDEEMEEEKEDEGKEAEGGEKKE
ncbi:histone chaperone ASF1-like, partial [Diaphorina citri]|uniref:Histone chaperone ASF1-like n=1 Tax=Diaphorina citri TaxID=121845 RepID=A0A3Q0JNV0_DIACI